MYTNVNIEDIYISCCRNTVGYVHQQILPVVILFCTCLASDSRFYTFSQLAPCSAYTFFKTMALMY